MNCSFRKPEFLSEGRSFREPKIRNRPRSCGCRAYGRGAGAGSLRRAGAAGQGVAAEGDRRLRRNYRLVLYVPEDGSEVRSLQTWVPMEFVWDLPETDRDGPSG